MSGIHIACALQRDQFTLEVDTKIPQTGVTGVFGPSGAGKTTLLRCVAGLEKSSDTTPVHKRQVGVVFQSPQLFAHLNVRDNIRYGLRRASSPSVDFDGVVDLLELGGLLDRKPDRLSGGEAQRVAIARALCQSPRMVLMDEPLSAIDEKRKETYLSYLDRVRAELDIPIVYVSHSIDEICRFSDHLLVLDHGRIVAEGDLQEVLARVDVPQLGGANTGIVIEAVPEAYDSVFGLSTLRILSVSLQVPGEVTGERVRIRIAANDVSLVRDRPDSSSILNIIPVDVVEVVVETTATALVKLAFDGGVLIARVTNRSVDRLDLQGGDSLFAQIKSVTVRR